MLTAHGNEEKVKEITPSSVGEYTHDGKCSFETSGNGNYEADKDALSGIQEEMQFGISSVPSRTSETLLSYSGRDWDGPRGNRIGNSGNDFIIGIENNLRPVEGVMARVVVF
ncbi:Hypothetical predicted protein [Olea europaea subsp. europaea]|uniref:Uncharacterized protein n=1 Tax=Olea europaea subsp. europaea TaxID=158383 RepID=A0A8S0TUD9_OLEEU|nr:Hypothetical predicted protein [Olea europaea subsp. europaea]